MENYSCIVHIVTWNSRPVIERCIESLLKLENLTLGKNLKIQITDNASSDDIASIVNKYPGIEFFKNSNNLGFCAAHNQGVFRFLKSDFTHLLILNPDTDLEPKSVDQMIVAFSKADRVGIVTPKIMRFKDDWPDTIDAAGMVISNEFRHFDRGSGEVDHGQYDEPGFVFGATGASLMISRACALDLLLESEKDPDIKAVFPQLADGYKERSPLFDESFFAFREDAELAFRANLYGWHCLYWPKAIVHHGRRVTPERRSDLPDDINLHGVRNRFLLQLLHWRFQQGLGVFIEGIVVRNFVVILGVLIRERSSIKAFKQVLALYKRSLARRHVMQKKAGINKSAVDKWFRKNIEN